MPTNFSNRKWGYDIAPNYSWFGSLVGRLGPDVSIIANSVDAQPDQYLWSSAHLNDLDDPQAIADRAFALKTLFDGALLVVHGSEYRPLDLGYLYDLSSSTRVPRLEGDVLAEPFSDEYLGEGTPEYLDPTTDFVNQSIFQSRYDRVSRDVLSFIGANGVTWISLYAALDILRHNGWDADEIARRGHASKAELKRFTGTANNAAAIGPFARHGEQGWEKPKKPMRLMEASDLLRPVIEAFLIDRALQVDVKAKWTALAR